MADETPAPTSVAAEQPKKKAPKGKARKGVKATHAQQFGALPYRHLDEGGVEVMLVTSRTTKRWIIPKGWPMGARPPHKVAAQEAMEEAGVEGRVHKRAVGFYHYNKLLSNGLGVHCRVDVFALHVMKQRSAWPERKQRDRRWMTLEEAAKLVGDADLAPLILAFAPEPPKKAAKAPPAG